MEQESESAAVSPPAADAAPQAEPEAVDPALLDSIFQKIAEFEAAPAAPAAVSAAESPASQPEPEVLPDQPAVAAAPTLAESPPPLAPVAEVVADPGPETEAIPSPAGQLPAAAVLPEPEPEPQAVAPASEAVPVAEVANPVAAPLPEPDAAPAGKSETETAGKALEEEAKMPVARVDVIRKATTKPADPVAKKGLPKWLYPVGLTVLACSTVGGGYWGWRMKHLSDEQAAVVVQQQEAILKQAMEDQKKISAVQEKFQAEVDEGKKLLQAEQQKSSAAEAALKLAEEKARVATAEKSKLAEEYARFKAGKTTRKPVQAQESRVHVPVAARKEMERSKLDELVLKKPIVPVPVREESGLASAVQLRPQWQALSAEQLTTLASQCQQASECIGIMLTAAEPYQRNAVEAATSRLSSIKTAKPYAGGESSDARSFASRVSDLIDENRISEAERIVDQALLADSGNSGVWMAMADLMAVKDKRKEATRALILAYELTPDKAKARRYFENSAKNAARVSLRPAYQAAVDSIFSIRLRGD